MFRRTPEAKRRAYKAWVQSWRERHPKAGGRCFEASLKMEEAFPELRVVNGYVVIPARGGLAYVDCGSAASAARLPPIQVSHWWCEAPDGTIYDPSGDQFTKILEYQFVSELVRVRD